MACCHAGSASIQASTRGSVLMSRSYLPRSGTMYRMAPDGSGQRRLSGMFAQIADWSPDGRYLVFEGRTGLTVLSSDGTAVGTIRVDVTEPGFPDWIE
jgi:Tol biopolymer transport system component